MNTTQQRGRHGHSHTPLYYVWCGMIRRCGYIKHRSYSNYGGRGISVCDTWKGPTGFMQFLTDMGERPFKGATLDREDNDGNYNKENCKWVSRSVQSRNKRSTRNFTVNGETMCMKDWSQRIGISIAGLKRRIDEAGWDIEEALTTPKGGIRASTQRSRTDEN